MKVRHLVVFAAALCLLTANAVFARSAGAQETTMGKRTYGDRCAVCHGSLGRGDGPMAGVLTPPPANLTLLAKQNGGEYPYARVYEVIDGRTTVTGHGTRQMPIWGSYFRSEQHPALTFPGIDPEEIVQARIYGLVYYIQLLQAK